MNHQKIIANSSADANRLMKPIVRFIAAWAVAIPLFVSIMSPVSAGDRDVVARMKTDRITFLRTVDESISGDELEAYPLRFAGKHVDLHCTVSGIITGLFSANCSTHKHGTANITIEDDSPVMVGQSIRVLGIAKALPGFDNSRRTSMWFPAVKPIEVMFDSRAR
jgi:hypothetical protein